MRRQHIGAGSTTAPIAARVSISVSPCRITGGTAAALRAATAGRAAEAGPVGPET